MKITTNKIKELIPTWLDLNSTDYNKCFDNFFGCIDLLPDEHLKYCKQLKCGKSQSEMLSAVKIFIADGKNWKRYEKAKFSLEEYNEEQNDQEKLIGWESDKFIPNSDRYIVRRFQSKFDGFDDRILRVLSNEEDTEIVSWGLFDS